MRWIDEAGFVINPALKAPLLEMQDAAALHVTLNYTKFLAKSGIWIVSYPTATLKCPGAEVQVERNPRTKYLAVVA